MKAYRIRVYGRVQRVGYRRFVLDLALSLKLSGNVKNEVDGSVSIFVQGSQDKLDLFVNRLENPPPPAYVEKMDIEEASVDPEIEYFKIIYGSLEEELQEGFGAMQSIFMDYWNEFRDYRGEFRDFREEFRDYREEFRDFREEFRDFRSEFRDFRSEFRDYREEFRDFREEFRDFREEFRDYRKEFREFAEATDRNFKILMERYGEISDKLTMILDTLVKESKETRLMIYEVLKMLNKALDRFGDK